MVSEYHFVDDVANLRWKIEELYCYQSFFEKLANVDSHYRKNAANQLALVPSHASSCLEESG